MIDLDNIELWHGDCLELMKDIPDNSIDLTVTSPPYDNLRSYNGNINQWSFEKFQEIAKELYRVTANGGVVVWVVADATVKGSETGTSFKQALFFKECGFNLYDTMIWLKPNPSVPTEGRYKNEFEYMFILSKGKPKALNFICDRPNKGYGRAYSSDVRISSEQRKTTNKRKTVGEFSRRHNVWEICSVVSNIERTKHPAPFPEQLANDHIISWSNEGDTVLDIFSGSGTTAKMAKLNNRNFIGFEISKEYCYIAEERLKSR